METRTGDVQFKGKSTVYVSTAPMWDFGDKHRIKDTGIYLVGRSSDDKNGSAMS